MSYLILKKKKQFWKIFRVNFTIGDTKKKSKFRARRSWLFIPLIINHRFSWWWRLINFRCFCTLQWGTLESRARTAHGGHEFSSRFLPYHLEVKGWLQLWSKEPPFSESEFPSKSRVPRFLPETYKATRCLIFSQGKPEWAPAQLLWLFQT